MPSIEDVKKALHQSLRTFDVMQDAHIKLEAAKKAVEQAVIAFDGLFAAIDATPIPPSASAELFDQARKSKKDALDITRMTTNQIEAIQILLEGIAFGFPQ